MDSEPERSLGWRWGDVWVKSLKYREICGIISADDL